MNLYTIAVKSDIMPSMADKSLTLKNTAYEDAQSKFMEDFQITGDIKKSMHLLDYEHRYGEYPAPLLNRAHNTIKDYQARGVNLMQGFLENKGVNLARISQVISDGLSANKEIRAPHTGEIIDTTPDHDTRRQFAQMALLLWGVESVQKKPAIKINARQNIFESDIKSLTKKLK